MSAAVNVAQAQQTAMPVVREFLDFINKAVTPFHAVTEITKMLESAGFTQVRETEAHKLCDPNGKYFVTRNQSSIVALSVGGKYKPGNGLKIVGGHTDSPNLSLKPHSKSNKADHVGVGVQLYGGILLHTWFDRDLTCAGRVILQNKPGEPLTSKLVHIKKPILRIPNLAIHLTTMDERSKGFSPNKETNTIPIIATELMTKAVGQQLEDPSGHCGPLMDAIAKEIGCETKQIVDFDLSIVDTQPAALNGLYDEFVVAPRIDNLLSCFVATKALIRSSSAGTVQAEDEMINIMALFDHEEVGSSSSPGAGGSLIPDIIDRITASLNTAERAALIAKSYFLSVDGAHGLHPNYSDRHNQEHRPLLHMGPVVKYNANQRYSTTGVTSAILLSIAKEAGVPVQQFAVKNDSPCGSTIGPILTTLSGIPGTDIGNPMWAMHSIRETCGTVDIDYLEKLIKVFFDQKAGIFQVREE